MLFTEQEQEEIAHAIESAESSTSGEIRIALEKHCTEDPLKRATTYFYKLNMQHTAQRNGVLIYMAYLDNKFAIIGDAGINKRVPENFWHSTKETMLQHFRDKELTAGLIAGILMAGEQLKKYFPHQSDDINELPNDIAFMDEEK